MQALLLKKRDLPFQIESKLDGLHISYKGLPLERVMDGDSARICTFILHCLTSDENISSHFVTTRLANEILMSFKLQNKGHWFDIAYFNFKLDLDWIIDGTTLTDRARNSRSSHYFVLEEDTVRLKGNHPKNWVFHLDDPWQRSTICELIGLVDHPVFREFAQLIESK